MNNSIVPPEMNFGSWIKLHRKIEHWSWYRQSAVLHVFLHCLLKANIAPKIWRGMTIERGQFFTSVARLRLETGVSEKAIRNALEKLERTGEIVARRASDGTMITVCKYATYNGETLGEGKPATNPTTNEATNPTTNEATNPTTNEATNNIIIEEGKTQQFLSPNAGALGSANPDLLPGFEASGREATPKPSGQSDDLHSGPNGKTEKRLPTGFADFWKVYPRRVGKADAITAWERALKACVLPRGRDLTEKIEAFKRTEEWQIVRFIPYPSTFINGRRWEDEIPVNGASVRPVLSPEERESQKETNRRKRDHMRFVESFREGSYTERSLPGWLSDYYEVTDEDRQKNKEAIEREPNVEPMDYPGGSDMKAEDLPEEEREKAAKRSAYYLEMLRSCRREQESHRQQIKP